MRTDNFQHSTYNASGSGEITIEWLGTPGGIFSHPRDVLDHPALDRSKKRAVLASWASDARAVENEPSLRQIDCGAYVPLREILSALRSLDDVPQKSAARVSFGSGARSIAPERMTSGDAG